jgi:LCP family protein required for cell wall assembly
MNRVKAKNSPPAGMTAGRIILLVFLSLLFIFFLAVYLFLNFYKPSIEIDAPVIGEDGWLEVPLVDAAGDDDGIQAVTAKPKPVIENNRVWGDNYNILLVGKDKEGFNTDTIMIVNFNVKDKQISVMSIPRDSYINNGYAKGKINGTLAKGYTASVANGNKRKDAIVAGLEFLEKSIIYNTFGIPIDKYIFIELAGFKELVDAVGGVEMYVPQNMHYEDPYQNLYINLQEGWQTLDGNKAEQLVRFREYFNADIGRVETQQKFMAALLKKMFAFDLTKIEKYFELAEKYVTTDLIPQDITFFAARLLNVKLENIRFHTLPTEWFKSLSISELYGEEVMEIINKYYNPYLSEIPEENFHIYDPDITPRPRDENIIDGKTLDKMLGN